MQRTWRRAAGYCFAAAQGGQILMPQTMSATIARQTTGQHPPCLVQQQQLPVAQACSDKVSHALLVQPSPVSHFRRSPDVDSPESMQPQHAFSQPWSSTTEAETENGSVTALRESPQFAAGPDWHQALLKAVRLLSLRDHPLFRRSTSSRGPTAALPSARATIDDAGLASATSIPASLMQYKSAAISTLAIDPNIQKLPDANSSFQDSIYQHTQDLAFEQQPPVHIVSSDIEPVISPQEERDRTPI